MLKPGSKEHGKSGHLGDRLRQKTPPGGTLSLPFSCCIIVSASPFINDVINFSGNNQYFKGSSRLRTLDITFADNSSLTGSHERKVVVFCPSRLSSHLIKEPDITWAYIGYIGVKKSTAETRLCECRAINMYTWNHTPRMRLLIIRQF